MPLPFAELLNSELQEFGLPLNHSQISILSLYCDQLTRWNKKINLTGLSGSNLVRRLVVEPVWVASQLKPTGVLLDIGSGNGSPAIPLHVVCQFTKCCLIEARLKRAAFLRHLTAELGLSGVEIHRARFEEVAPDLSVPDWITLQAVALTPALMAAIRGVAKADTTIVWITSSSATLDVPPSRVLTIPTTGTQVCLIKINQLSV